MRYALIAILILALSPLAFSQDLDESQETNSVNGTIAHIDWVAEKLVVRTADFGEMDEITFMVSGDTRITKGTNIIPFSAVNQSSAITVKYHSDSFAGLQADSITIK